MCLRKMSLSIVVSFSRTVPARECALGVDTACRITACKRHNLLQPDPPANHHLHLLPVGGEPERAVESDEGHFHLTRVRSDRTVREYVREERETQVSTHVLGLHTYRAGARVRSRLHYRYTDQADTVSPYPTETSTSFVFDRRVACTNETMILSLQRWYINAEHNEFHETVPYIDAVTDSLSPSGTGIASGGCPHRERDSASSKHRIRTPGLSGSLPETHERKLVDGKVS